MNKEHTPCPVDMKKLMDAAKKRKEGEWIICSDGYYPYCSVCNYWPPREMNPLPAVCPKCGTRMRNPKEKYNG